MPQTQAETNEQCTHSKAKASDQHCGWCGKQLREYCYKKCQNCNARITEEDWEAMPLIRALLEVEPSL